MDRLGPLGAHKKRGDTTVDLARSIEPGRATTESANHLRIPDLRNDQAEETIKASAAGCPAAVRASICAKRSPRVRGSPLDRGAAYQMPAARFGLWVDPLDTDAECFLA